MTCPSFRIPVAKQQTILAVCPCYLQEGKHSMSRGPHQLMTMAQGYVAILYSLDTCDGHVQAMQRSQASMGLTTLATVDVFVKTCFKGGGPAGPATVKSTRVTGGFHCRV